jgi:hypothetical protein
MRPHKFNAKSIVVEGVKFPSIIQGECYRILNAAQQEPSQWLIVDCEVEFKLLPAQILPGGKKEREAVFTVDFVLNLKPSGRRILVEVKSDITRKAPDYILRRKMLYYFHKLTVIEIESLTQMRMLVNDLRCA